MSDAKAAENGHLGEVERDDCNGRTLACVACDVPLGGHHNILCSEFKRKLGEARRER